MTWKTGLRLSDLPPDDRLEITCRKCCGSYYRTPTELMALPGFRQFYIDEAEANLTCRLRHCLHPRVLISQQHGGREMEGFVGGMP